MKIKIDLDANNNADYPVFDNNNEQQQHQDYVSVTVSTCYVFDMKIAPGMTVSELAADLADKGYDVKNAEVTLVPSSEHLELSNHDYRLNGDDKITFETKKTDVKSMCGRLLNIIDELANEAEKNGEDEDEDNYDYEVEDEGVNVYSDYSQPTK